MALIRTTLEGNGEWKEELLSFGQQKIVKQNHDVMHEWEDAGSNEGVTTNSVKKNFSFSLNTVAKFSALGDKEFVTNIQCHQNYLEITEPLYIKT